MVAAVKTVDEIKAELKEVRAKKATRKAKESEPTKKDWYGLVYCDSNGYASIIGRNQEGIWLGKANEFIPFLKSRGITGENVDSVLSALEEFQAEQKKQGKSAKAENPAPRVSKNHSGHSNIKTPQPYIIDQGEKPIVATFKHNPQILSLLESLITRDIGVRTIHSELKKRGYNIPQRTVTRWVSKMRSKELL